MITALVASALLCSVSVAVGYTVRTQEVCPATAHVFDGAYEARFKLLAACKTAKGVSAS